MENKKLVFIYTIPRDSVLGLHSNVDPNSGKRLNKTKLGLTEDSIQALYNVRTGKLSNYISTTPWLDDNGEVKLDKNGKALTLQDKLELEWHLAPGELTDEPVGNPEDIYTNRKPLTYFQQKSWPLADGCTVLDLTKKDDLMCYYVCLASKLVANSEKEWRGHKWPNARYYIALENEADEISYKVNQNKLEAYAMLSSSEMTPILKRKIAILLGITNVKADVPDLTIDNALYMYIDKADTKQLANISKFKDLYNKAIKPDSRIEFEARFLMERALAYRVFSEKQGTYTWIRSKGSIELGNKPETVIAFLVDPKKQDLVEELEKEIKLKSNE